MGTRRARPLPTQFKGVQRRFERWRRTRKIPTRIPGVLWALAAKMAGAYGISRTAKMLRVNYSALKQRIEEGAAGAGGHERSAAGQRFASVPAFLELAPSPTGGPCECTLELEDAAGAKMRVHLKGIAMPDLAELSRSFWNPAS
ncbi:MAG: hypothetical protein ABSF26_05770 [Thermoguttaceae bacterium]|jgi:hypothetical protein